MSEKPTVEIVEVCIGHDRPGEAIKITSTDGLGAMMIHGLINSGEVFPELDDSSTDADN